MGDKRQLKQLKQKQNRVGKVASVAFGAVGFVVGFSLMSDLFLGFLVGALLSVATSFTALLVVALGYRSRMSKVSSSSD